MRLALMEHGSEQVRLFTEELLAMGPRVTEFTRQIQAVVGRGGVEQVPWPKDWKVMDVGDVVISNARFKKRFGWSPKVGLDDGLARTRDFFQARLSDYVEEGS